jgi:hypothetical protein
MRGDLEQVEAAARAIVRASAVAPRYDAELRVAERREVLRPVDHVAWQRRDFLFHRRERAGAWRVWPLVQLGLSFDRATIRLWRGGLLRGRRLLFGRQDPDARRSERDDEGTVNDSTDVMRGHARTLPHCEAGAHRPFPLPE